MKIISCKIENFGKLSNCTFQFEEGCNTLCQPNGWGKSTLCAFIKVMFFGFSNGGVRDELRNERKRYKPWQGGVYGGQLTFEVSDCQYVISRTFGSKEREDTFELRDAATNLKSDAFSDKIGEELFQIDGDSFGKTVLLSQGSCDTGATDSINAKLGNLAEQTDDILKFEQVRQKLADKLNAMSPKRKTGALYKMKEALFALQQKVSTAPALEASVLQQEQQHLQYSQEKDALDKQMEEIVRLRKQLSFEQDSRVVRQKYALLREQEEQCLAKWKAAQEQFPNGLPSLEGYKEVTEQMQQLRALFREAFHSRHKLEEVTDKMEKVNRQHMCAYDEAKWKLTEQRHMEETRNKDKKWLLPVGIELGLLVLLLVCLILQSAAGYGVVLVMLLVAGGFALQSVRQKQDGQTAVAVEEEKLEALQKEQLAKTQLLEEEIGRLQTTLQQQTRQCEALWTVVEEYLRRYNRDYHTQRQNSGVLDKKDTLTTIYWAFEGAEMPLRHLYAKWLECEELEEAYYKEKTKRELCESEIRFKDISMEPDPEVAHLTMEQVNEQLEQIEQAHKACEEKARVCMQLCESQLKSLEELEVDADRLVSLQQQYDQKLQHYQRLEKTKALLEKAKETFTAKYTAPIMNGFEKYYSMISGTEREHYHLDANINLTIEEQGLQREIRFLSAGYQDLAGICMRMALVDAMYGGEKPFIIFDDPFTNLDSEKLKGALAFLQEVSKEYQIIYFTCHENRKRGAYET